MDYIIILSTGKYKTNNTYIQQYRTLLYKSDKQCHHVFDTFTLRCYVRMNIHV